MFSIGFAQETSVEAKGIGVGRADALQDALRNAVSQAAGVVLSSNTTVENFMVISDAIATNTKGYIKSYTILNEKTIAEGYEVSVKALVTTLAMKADFALLAKGVGGVRFMAIYDVRNVQEKDKANYDYVLDQMNTYFAAKKYRYIERTRFLQLQKEALMLMEDRDTSGVSYAQQLALLADAQFIIMVKNIDLDSKSENFETRKSYKLNIQTVVYDNCTSEGLGNQTLESNYLEEAENNTAIKNGITSAVKNNMDDLIETFSAYIGGWINNGIPYELRFYGVGGFRDLRDLRTKLKTDALFGGEMEMVGAQNYTKINCTYKKKPDELADKILDFSDQIPALAPKKIDVKLIFGRQISFAPQGIDINKKKVKDVLVTIPEKKLEQPKSVPVASEIDISQSKPDPTTPGFVIFSEAGEKFWLIINGTKQNEKPLAKVWKNNIVEAGVKIRIMFQDAKIPTIDQNIMINNLMSGEKFNSSYTIKKKPKGNYVIRMVGATPIKSSTITPKIDDFNVQNTDTPTIKSKEEQKPLERKCETAINSTDFIAVNAQLKAEAFSETKFAIFKQIFASECLTIIQIRELTKQFSFDQDKIDLVKMAYNSCVEKQRYYLLNDVFSFSSSKQEFATFLESLK